MTESIGAPVPAELLLAHSILGPIAEEVVFVGGATIPLWITDPAAPAPRATDDVDVVCDVATYGAYQDFAERLRQQQLVEAADSTVICRWVHSETGLIVDVMPVEEEALGFSNAWYRMAIDTAADVPLPNGGSIKVARPEVLFATKLAAWHGRGGGDVQGSIDLGDIITLINGRAELLSEFRAASIELRAYVAAEMARLSADPYFDYLVQDIARGYGEVAAARADVIRERIASISEE